VMILTTEDFYCEIRMYCGHNLIWLTVLCEILRCNKSWMADLITG
jgi:hypothetical protein